jgi:cephalosporin-C deacetylase-like acetyl esterase
MRTPSPSLFFVGLSFLSSFFWVLSAQSQEEAPKEPLSSAAEYSLKVTTDKAEPLYSRGELVKYSISFTRNGSPVAGARVKWRLSKDGVEPPLEDGVADISSGTAGLSGKLDEPGFLQCRADVSIPGVSIRSARAAGAVDPLAILPSLPMPDDFVKFWDGQKKKLSEIPIALQLTPVKASTAGVDCFDAQAASVGAPMSGYLAKPSGAIKNSLPAILLCHGAGVASSRQKVVEGWAKDGFLALDFNAHGLPNGKAPEFYKNLYTGELKEYYLKSAESRDTVFFLGLFLRLLRGIDVLTSQPEWDGEILIANGRSQGGGQAFAAAGLDSRVKFFAAQIPALCDLTGMAVGRIQGWPKALSMDGDKLNPKAMEASRYFDAVNFARLTKADALVTVGFIDVSCSPTGVYAAYNQLQGKKRIINNFTTGHAGSKEADAQVREAILNCVHGKNKNEKNN